MKVTNLDISSIDDGDRAREEYGDIEELAENIEDVGLLQPITVRRLEEGLYKLLAGGRRLKACTHIGMVKIPSVIRGIRDKINPLEIELIENVYRKDFSWAERCRLEQRVFKMKEEADSSWSQTKTATLLNRTRSCLSQDLELADAMVAMPELAEYPTQSEAWKKWNHVKEDLVVGEVVRRQAEKSKGIAKKDLPPTERGRFSSLHDYIETKYTVRGCFEGMAELDSSIINFVEVDPPYAVDLASHRNKAQDKHIVSTYNEIDPRGYGVFLVSLAESLYRVMNENSWGIIWYGSKWYPDVLMALDLAGFKTCATPAIWVKTGGGYSPNPKILLSNLYENFLVFRKGTPTLHKEGRGNVFQFAQPSSKERIHPTERPIELMEELLSIFTSEASITLVPFLGSGVTLRAAYNMNRTAFGYDKDPVYKDRLIAGEVQDGEV